jgi:diaminopimelate decarboxylase
VSLDALDTHAHIATGHDEAKFGVPRAQVELAITRIGSSAHLDLVGIGAHVGSQITTTDAYVESARVLFEIVRAARASGVTSLKYVDTGGGFGIDYGAGCEAKPADFVRAARAEQKRAGLGDLALYTEPGRSLVAAHGVLIASVIQTKTAGERRWLMIDAGMNDLIRPALYQARHRIVPLERAGHEKGGEPAVDYCVVGPVCESSDDFGVHPLTKTPPREVAILDAGAYGFTMACQYNGRPLAAEVFLRGGSIASRTPRGDVRAWIASRVGTR